MKTISRFVLPLVSLLSLPLAATAQFTMVIEYSAITGDTTITYDGNWATYSQTASFGSGFPADFGPNAVYTNITGAYGYDDGAFNTPFPWNSATVTATTGDPWGFDQFGAYAPAGYIAGTTLSGTMTLGSTDLSDLGLNPGQSGVAF
ncbi:hypothetical protein, partial [Puniceicoccus vermicola]